MASSVDTPSHSLDIEALTLQHEHHDALDASNAAFEHRLSASAAASLNCEETTWSSPYRVEAGAGRAAADSQDVDFCDLDELGFFEEQGLDKRGRRIIRIEFSSFPYDSVPLARLRRYIWRRVQKLTSADDAEESAPSRPPADNSLGFTILYVHSCDERQNFTAHPPFSWFSPSRFLRGWGQKPAEVDASLERRSASRDFGTRGGESNLVEEEQMEEFGWLWVWRLLEMLPLSFCNRICSVIVLHPSASLRLGLWLLSPWLPSSLYDKVIFVSRIEFLAEYTELSEVDFSLTTFHHDQDLDKSPLLDYGFVVDETVTRATVLS